MAKIRKNSGRRYQSREDNQGNASTGFDIIHIMADYFARVKELEHISELIF